jgi:hypothetical protein
MRLAPEMRVTVESWTSYNGVQIDRPGQQMLASESALFG